MRVRTASVYTLTASTLHPNEDLDVALACAAQRPEVAVHQSFVSRGVLTLRFRIPTHGRQKLADAYAVSVATAFTSLFPTVSKAELHTGFGVNRRLVAQH